MMAELPNPGDRVTIDANGDGGPLGIVRPYQRYGDPRRQLFGVAIGHSVRLYTAAEVTLIRRAGDKSPARTREAKAKKPKARLAIAKAS